MFENKTILITGSSRGIGAATARLAKHYGANVILHGKEETPRLVELSKELNARYIFCDVENKSDVESQINRLLEEGAKIDVLINSAGISISKTFLDTTDEDWSQTFAVNVFGTVHFCQALIPHMQKNNYGRIVNISSIRGYESTSGRPSYSASKAAIINLTSTLAKEFSPIIAINCIAPGFTETDMSQTWNERIWNQAKSSLLSRIANPNEIAEAILFLASERASFITGQTLVVDGGYTLSGK